MLTEYEKLNLILSELMTMDNADKIKDKFIELASSGAKSNIEALIFSRDNKIYNDLKKVILKLTPEDWFSIVGIKQKNKLNFLDKWYQANANVDSLDFDGLDLIMLNITPEHKFQLLTQLLVKEKAANSKDSLLIILSQHNDKCIELLKDLGDNQIFNALLSFPGFDKNYSCLYISSPKDAELLINLIEYKAIRTQLTNIFMDHHKTKKTTHFLGIKDIGTEFNVATNQNTVVKANQPIISFEGTTDAAALDYFRQVLNTFTPTQEFTDIFNKIKQSFNQAKEKGNPDLDFTQDYIRYQQNQLIIIPAGWPGHSITIAATDNFLVVANRGQGLYQEGLEKKERGCVIYPLQQPLELVDIEVFSKKENELIIKNKINELVKKNHQNDPKILQALPIQAQKYGTCGVANKKAVVAGLLFLDQYLKLNQPDNASLVKQQILADTRAEYKRFTEHTRKFILDEMLEALDSPKADTNPMLIQGLANFFNQHLDLTKPTEKALLISIITKMPESITQVFLGKLTLAGRLVYHLLPDLNDNDAHLLTEAINFLPRIDNFKQEEFFTLVNKLLKKDAAAKSKETLDNVIKANFSEILIDKLITPQDWLKDEYFEFLIATKNYALCIETVGEKEFIAKLEDKIEANEEKFFSQYYSDPQKFSFILNRFSSQKIESFAFFRSINVPNLFYALLSQPIDTQKLGKHLKNLQQLSEKIQDSDKISDYLLAESDPTENSGLTESFKHSDLASFTLGFLNPTQLMQQFLSEFSTQEWIEYCELPQETQLEIEFDGVKSESIFDKAIRSNAALVIFDHLKKNLSFDQLQALVSENIEGNLKFLAIKKEDRDLLKKYIDSAKNHLPNQPYFEELLKAMAGNETSHCLPIIRPYLGDNAHELVGTHYSHRLNFKVNHGGSYISPYFLNDLEEQDIELMIKKLVNHQQDWVNRLSKIIKVDKNLNRYVALLSAFPAKYRKHFLPLPLLGILLEKHPEPDDKLLKQLVGSPELIQCAQLIKSYETLPLMLQEPLCQFLKNPNAQHLIALLKADDSLKLKDWLIYSSLQLTASEKQIFRDKAVMQQLEQKSYSKVLSELASTTKSSSGLLQFRRQTNSKPAIDVTAQTPRVENKKKPKPN
jgi:hypothetical protein